MERAGAKGGRGAHELKLTGRHRDEGTTALVRFPLCLALGLRNIKHLNPLGESHEGFLYDSMIIEVSSQCGLTMPSKAEYSYQ